jgi:hypothetical protein
MAAFFIIAEAHPKKITDNALSQDMIISKTIMVSGSLSKEK